MDDQMIETRGQKRSEISEDLPADKRACSSSEFTPGSSTVAQQPADIPEAVMGTSSSSSASDSGRSEGDRDYGSEGELHRSSDSDMDEVDYRFSNLRDIQHSQAYQHSSKFGGILSNLNNDADSSGQVAALTEFCELLSFCTEDAFSSSTGSQFAPVLVKLANHESNPDIMLLSIRALTYFCDVYPRFSSLLVRHNAVPVLCQRLVVIEYLDVAEQCLQALEKISREQPQACLQSGAIMAVLGYLDFFSTIVQRTALSVVVNICKKLPSECPSPVMGAVERLCNLLEYEDQQLVELAATCLIKITDKVKDVPKLLSNFHGQGLINQSIRLISVNSHVTISQTTYTGIIGMLVKLASESLDAVRTLFDLQVGSILKNVLSDPDFARGVPSPRLADRSCNRVHESLKLLHQLLPDLSRDQNVEAISTKETILVDQPDRLQKFGRDILPALIQVVRSDASTSVCYGCLSVINRIVYFSKPDILYQIVEEINIASFLVGVFTCDNDHILLSALQITQTVLEKLSNVLMQSFIKEGIVFAIDALLMPDGCPQLCFPVMKAISNRRSTEKEASKCLCNAYGNGQNGSTSGPVTCNVDEKCVHNLAEHIKTTFFPIELNNPQNGVSNVLQELKNSSLAIMDLLNTSPSGKVRAKVDDELRRILHSVMAKFVGNEPISTFELIESGIIKALLKYLSNGDYLRSNCGPGNHDHMHGVQNRFETFATILLSSSDVVSVDVPLSMLVRLLQSALSTVETFPVIAGSSPRQRASYAAVPSGRNVAYQSLQVRFLKAEEELGLSDYSADFVTVDPFCLVEEIEKHLRPKVSKQNMECHNTDNLPDPQVDMDWSPTEPSGLGQTVVGDTTATQEAATGFLVEKDHLLHADAELGKCTQNATSSTSPCTDEDDRKKTQSQLSCNLVDVSGKLELYLDGEQLAYSSTLYQEILQRLMKAKHVSNDVAMWSSKYTVTYKRAAVSEGRNHNVLSHSSDIGPSDMPVFLQPVLPFLSGVFTEELCSDVDPSSATCDLLYLLKSLEMMNRLIHHLISYERMNAFAEGNINSFDDLRVVSPNVQQYEFVNTRLTEKLEQQMQNPLSMHVGSMPSWCNQLLSKCPFLFSFEVRCKYFQLAAFGRSNSLRSLSSRSDTEVPRNRSPTSGGMPRKKFMVSRDHVLESAGQMMEIYGSKKVVIEVEYSEEVGTGLGPTLEFFTLVSHGFQKPGLGMWRGDHFSAINEQSQHVSGSESMYSLIFPRPWPPSLSNIDGIEFSDVLKKFSLLGQVVGKALHDGRVLDIPFSYAFYKLILGKELTNCDIHSFDPVLGRTLLELQALASRGKFVKHACKEDIAIAHCSGFRGANIEDLCLDFTLPGYPEYILASGINYQMVNADNLEEFVSLVLDATLRTGISRQVEAFKSGLNQVIADMHLHIFAEEELERLLCGEHDSWASSDLLDHMKFDHGYTAGSLPVINLLEVISEFNFEDRRAFLQFVTGSPRLPPGGLASLNPKLTIVCKNSSNDADTDLPSVMTCANYLKLPPYTSKERLKEKLLYAITEGQGSFHLS